MGGWPLSEDLGLPSGVGFFSLSIVLLVCSGVSDGMASPFIGVYSITRRIHSRRRINLVGHTVGEILLPQKRVNEKLEESVIEREPEYDTHNID